MDRETQTNDVFTKVNQDAGKGVFLTSKDAEEFRAYKRRKKMTEVALAVARSEGSLFCGEDVRRICERAIRLQQAAIKTPLSKLAQVKGYLAGSFVRIDCVVGGNGETLAKVKAFEARTAARKGAKEITVPVTPSLFDSCRYTEIRKELKSVKRAIGKTALKVRVEKISSPTALSRLARIASEIGARYLSVPYFAGCERLRLDLTCGCLLETTGVKDLETYRTLTEKGVERIATDNAWEIYNDWMREAQETPLTSPEPERVSENSAEDKLPPCVSAAKILALAEKAKTEENGSTDGETTDGKKEMELRLL